MEGHIEGTAEQFQSVTDVPLYVKGKDGHQTNGTGYLAD